MNKDVFPPIKVVRLPKVEAPTDIDEERVLDLTKVHPGYSWRRIDSYERVFENNQDKSLLIDVLGKEEQVQDKHGEWFFKENVIVTVIKEDAELYQALQIKGMFRNHGDVTLGYTIMTLLYSAVITIFGTIVLVFTHLTPHMLWQVPAIFFGSVFLIALLSFVKNRFKYSYRFLLLVYKVWKWKFKLLRTSGYYKNLLKTLSLCNNKDKAGTAKTLRYFV